MCRHILPSVFTSAAIAVAGCSGEKGKEYALGGPWKVTAVVVGVLLVLAARTDVWLL